MIVGVHGIAQQQVGRHQLQAPWARALADGIERATGHPVAVPDLDVAFYGDLFLDDRPAAVKGAGKSTDAVPDLDEADIPALLEAAEEVLTEAEMVAAADDAATKGFGRLPTPLLRALAALDRRFGAHAGALFVGELGQARRYLLAPLLKQAADARVADTVTGDCRALIGHSLGSVVALEYLRLHPEQRLDLLLTLGSPLGLRAVRHLMPEPEFGTGDAGPANVGRWVNLRDPRDPVSCAGGLAPWWPAVDDEEVDNGRSAHSVERYLGKRQTGEAVAAVMPEVDVR